jgi:predicted DNA-binding transcriptional regulator AlpA
MLIGYDELRERHGIKYSKPHLWRLIKQGVFPKPIKIGSPAGHVKAIIAARDLAVEKTPEE